MAAEGGDGDHGRGIGGPLRAWLPLLVFAAMALTSLALWWRLERLEATAGESILDEVLLGLALAACALFALAIHLRRLARERAAQAELACARLQESIEAGERARGALDAAERQLVGLFESISDAFYMLDREWRFSLLNPRAAQLMRRPREALLGQVVWELFPEVLGTEVERQFRRAVHEGCTVEFEIHFPPLETWFSVRAYPHPEGLAVYFLDIGDRKRTDLALAKARATSERAQQLAQLGDWEYELATGRLRWSEQLLRIFGMTPQQLSRGLPALLERVHAEDRPALVEAQRRLHAGEGDTDIEYRVQRTDGQLRVVRELGTLVRDAAGQPAFATGALQDITDQRRGEDALRESTRRLEQSLVTTRLVMENSLDVICVWDANGRFANASRASERIWGYAPAELIGRDHLDLVHPDDREASRAMAARTQAGEPTTDFRNRVRRKDGGEVVMQWSATWSARERLFFAVGRDITEAERQSQALLEAKESLHRAQSVARMGAWELDVATDRLTWTDEVYDIFGVSRQDYPDPWAAFLACVHPDDLATVQQAQAIAMTGEAELDIEHRIIRPDGTVGHVHERGRLLRDAQGRPVLQSGSVQDVTERKRQQALLLESGRRMRATVDSALDCIVAMDAQGLVVEFNPAAERTFGYRRDQAIGRSLAGLIVPPAHRAGHEEGLRRHRETGVSRVMGRRLELPALRADGSQILVELSITPMTQDGELTYVGFLRDITLATRVRSIEEGQRGILAGIAARQPLPDSLDALARLYERQFPGALCSVQLMDAAGECLLSGAAPSLPEGFVAAIHGARIGPGEGSCGTAAYRGEQVIVSDIANDPLWRDYAALAAEHGLRACWSTPIKRSDGRVLATFANYYREVREPTADELAVVDGLASLAAVAIEQAQARDAADSHSRQLQRLSEAAIGIHRCIGTSDLYPVLADSLRETIGAHQALVVLSSGEGGAQQVHALSFSGKYAQWQGVAAPPDGNGIHSIVCETNRPMRMGQAELQAHPRWRSFAAEVGRHPPMRGWLAVPLVASDGSNRGVLQLSDKYEGDFTQDDELVAVQFAQMASIAIERAELIGKLVVRERFFELSLEIFVIYDPAVGRWRQVNPVFCETLGYTAQELCSRDFRDFIHPDDVPATTERSQRLARDGDVPRHFENRYLCRDGSVRSIEWVSVRGPDALVYGVGRDITQRREAETALRQTLVDLGHRNRELQDFAFIASHDLQEPLRKIRAFSDRLQQRHADALPPEAREYLDRSHKAAARMQTLIDDLLAYSRVAARGKPFAPVDLGALLAGVAGDLEASLETSGGRIDAGPLPTIDGDPVQLRQMLQNLLSNALKFRAKDRPPVVEVSAERTELAGEPAWRVRIRDNGIGFEDRYADKIFGPFQRLHGREAYEGTGIGLAIVRRIVERHRGTVTAEGRIGEGATFSLVLPERQASPAGTPAGPFMDQAGK